jgi:glyoxylase-like metal-dependent hydrolase (beta-lactamase superfamily II)
MFTGDTLMTRDPMFGGEGPLVFSEHPAKDELCLANLQLLRPFASAGLLPAHGEPDPTVGALGAAITRARIAKAS